MNSIYNILYNVRRYSLVVGVSDSADFHALQPMTICCGVTLYIGPSQTQTDQHDTQ